MSQYLPIDVRAPIVGTAPYGLFSVVQMPLDGLENNHWRNGVQFQGDPCAEAGTTLDPCPTPGPGYVKTPTTDGLPTRGAMSFSVYASLPCSPVGQYWEEANARVAALLTNGEARAVERTFWTGATTNAGGEVVYPHLAADAPFFSTGMSPVELQTAAVVITGVLDIVEAVGELERALGECFGGVGVIHAPREALTHMAANFLISPRGGVQYTANGTPVAFGGGYPGTSPAGAPPTAGTVWMYATGPVMMRKSEIAIRSTPTQSLDRSVNTLTMIAERTYNLAWDCCHFAVQASMGGVISGAAGSAIGVT